MGEPAPGGDPCRELMELVYSTELLRTETEQPRYERTTIVPLKSKMEGAAHLTY
jgi:hypothetical protein